MAKISVYSVHDWYLVYYLNERLWNCSFSGFLGSWLIMTYLPLQGSHFFYFQFDRQVPCFLTQTNTSTHKVITENLHLNRHVLEEVTGPRSEKFTFFVCSNCCLVNFFFIACFISAILNAHKSYVVVPWASATWDLLAQLWCNAHGCGPYFTAVPTNSCGQEEKPRQQLIRCGFQGYYQFPRKPVQVIVLCKQSCKHRIVLGLLCHVYL